MELIPSIGKKKFIYLMCKIGRKNIKGISLPFSKKMPFCLLLRCSFFVRKLGFKFVIVHFSFNNSIINIFSTLISIKKNQIIYLLPLRGDSNFLNRYRINYFFSLLNKFKKDIFIFRSFYPDSHPFSKCFNNGFLYLFNNNAFNIKDFCHYLFQHSFSSINILYSIIYLSSVLYSNDTIAGFFIIKNLNDILRISYFCRLRCYPVFILSNTANIVIYYLYIKSLILFLYSCGFNSFFLYTLNNIRHTLFLLKILYRWKSNNK